MTLRFLTSFGMTESYVIREGWAAASPPPTPPTHLPLESPVIPNEVRNLLQVYRTTERNILLATLYNWNAQDF
ncbi:MAG: hypothetical protein ACNA7V_15180 [Bacteroidales bacterium]